MLIERTSPVHRKIVDTVYDAFINPFGRIPLTIALGISSLVPQMYQFFKGKNIRSITKENIHQHQNILRRELPSGLPAPTKRQFKSLLKRTEKLRRKIIPNQQVILYTGPKRMSTGVIGNRISLTPALFFIDITDIKRPKAELEGVLAHELAHLQQNHNLQSFFFSLTTLLVDVVAFMMFPPLIFVAEGVSSLLESPFSKHKERVADRRAMKYLNSNKGVASYWKKAIKRLQKIKSGSDQEVRKLLDPRVRRFDLSEKKLKKLREGISKKGNIRFNRTHPKETDRLRQAYAFINIPVVL